VDHGASWTNLAPLNPITDSRASPIGVLPNGNLLMISGSPTSGTIYRSTNSGTSWDSIGTSPFTGVTRKVKRFAVSGTQVVFAATYGDSLYRSNDTARTWNYLGCYPTLQDMGVNGDTVLYVLSTPGNFDSTYVYQIPFHNGTTRMTRMLKRYTSVYAGDFNGALLGGEYPGILRTQNGRTFSASVDSILDQAIKFVRFGSSNRTHVFTEYAHYYSDDLNYTWQQSNFTHGAYKVAQSSQNILYTIDKPDTTAAMNHVYLSTDNGTTWDTTVSRADGWVYDIAVTQNGTLYASVYSTVTHGFEINFSTNQGSYWDHASFNPVFNGTSDLVATDTSIYVCTPTGVYRCYSRAAPINVYSLPASYMGRGLDGLYYLWRNSTLYSADALMTHWQDMFPPENVTSGRVAVNAQGHINLLNGTTVYTTTDRGTTWNIGLGGLLTSTVNQAFDLQVYPANSTLYAGLTHGLYHTLVPVTSIPETELTQLPTAPILLGNYPNPFNSTTAISFSLPKSSETKLAVYNLSGERVATLLSQNEPAGTHSVRWSAQGYSSGVYFLKMSMGTMTQTRKIVLLK